MTGKGEIHFFLFLFLKQLVGFFFFLVLFAYLRGIEKQREEDSTYLLVHSQNCPQQLGLDQATAGNWELNAGLPSVGDRNSYT